MVMQNRGLAVLKLVAPNHAKCQKLNELQTKFSHAFEVGLRAVENTHHCKPSEVHAKVYPLSRQSGLPATYARLVVNEIVAAKRRFHRKGKSNNCRCNGVGLPANSYRLINKHGHWAIRMSLGEHGGLLWLPLHVPQKLSYNLEKAKGDARLFQRDGDWYAAIPFHPIEPAIPPYPSSAASVTGVDLGIARLITAYSEGTVRIVRGAPLMYRRKQIRSRHQTLAQNGFLTKAKQLKLRERRWVSYVNHSLAAELVDLANKHTNPVLTLEKLDGLIYRKPRSHRFSQMSRAWDFRQLVDLVVCKAREKRVQVVFVDPRGTSATCPRCHQNLAENASPQGRFSCRNCGYTSITDIVAAQNIATRYVQE